MTTLIAEVSLGRARSQSVSDRLALVTIQERDVMDRLRSLIRDVPDFPRPGIVFKDITLLLGDAAAFSAAIAALAAPYRDARVDIVAGIESRGFILGGAVADRLGAGFALIRKEGRLPAARISQAYTLEYGEAVIEMHSDAIQPGQRVLIIDDLLATGGTAGAAGALVDRLGGDIVGFAFLIELSARTRRFCIRRQMEESRDQRAENGGVRRRRREPGR
jgi:adenine phosphoribosyltransferase